MATNEALRVAGRFRKLGWLGLVLQLALAVLPIGMLVYLMLGKMTGGRPTLGFFDYLAIVGLGVLLFTALWSFRYTRLARKIADPERTPTVKSVTRTIWVGLWAGTIGVFISLFLLVAEVVRLLILFLKTPQGGVPVLRTEAGDRADWVSALDAVSLLAELCTLAGELVILALSLWLLFTVMRNSHVFKSPEVKASH